MTELFPLLATNRLPDESKSIPVGELSPVLVPDRFTLGAMLSGLASVEPAGRGRGNSRISPLLSDTNSTPFRTATLSTEVKPVLEPASTAMGATLPFAPGAYSVTEEMLATKMSPEPSTAMPKGLLSPVADPEMVAMGAALSAVGPGVRGREYPTTARRVRRAAGRCG